MWFWPKKNDELKTGAVAQAGADAASGAAALTREVAGIASDMYEPLSGFIGAVPNRDPLLQSQTPGSFYAYAYGLFEEALDKDAHLAAIVAQRKAAVLSWERSIAPADSSPEARAVAQFVEAALEGIGARASGARASLTVANGGQGRPPSGQQAKTGETSLTPTAGGGFEHDLSELLDAIPYGFAVSEVLWEEVQSSRVKVQADPALATSPEPSTLNLDPGRILVPAALLSRHPRRFVFGADSEPRLLTAAQPLTGEALPWRKFLVFAPYGRHENPYGLPALRSVWWLAYFKRQALKFWVMYAEKFGSPTAVLKHPLSATEKEKRAYRRIIGTIQQETGLVVPEGVDLSLLEAQRAGSVGTYRELCDFCNREMSKALLGQTLTTEVAERGSLGLGSVHYAVREDIVRQDARALMALINGQLIRWIVDLNFPPAMRLYPRWELKPPSAQDLGLQLEIDRFFAERGLGVDEAELYARYGRKKDTGSRMQDSGKTKTEVAEPAILTEP